MIRMKNTLKQSGESDTNSRPSQFFKARLKLAIYYTAGIFLVLTVFSVAVYTMFGRDISENIEVDSSQSQNADSQMIDIVQEQLKMILITADGFIVLIFAGLGYYLAGKTLFPIEMAYKKQRKFVSDAAHELRTPLAVLKTGIQASRESENVQEYKKILDDSVEEVNHLSRMVNDLLFLAQSDEGQDVFFEKVDLGRLLSKQIDFMLAYAVKNNIKLKKDFAGEFFVRGNRSQLKRLFSNLIKNAIDYNKSAGEVFVSIDKNNDGIRVSIIDTGIGISDKDLEHILERFYKADEARVRASSGAGLGLSLVKEIVDLHKGKMKIKSALEKGTEATILFPAIYS